MALNDWRMIMSNMRKLTLIAAFLAITFGLQNAVAKPPGKMAEALNLSAGQIEAFEALKQERRATRGDRKEIRNKIQDLVRSGDTEAAANLAAEQARQRVYRKAEFHGRMKEILTAEQLEKFESMPNKRERKRGKKHGKGKGDCQRK